MAREFLDRHTTWLAHQLERLAAQPRKPTTWILGTEIFHRGERVRVEAVGPGCVRFADQVVAGKTDPYAAADVLLAEYAEE